MSDYDYDDNEEPGFLQKHRFVIVAFVVLLLAIGVGLASHFLTGKIPPPRKPAEITISLPPPPPPPPPPPTPPPPKPPPPEQKMVEQPPVKPNEEKPKDLVKSPEKAPGPPGPKANGPPTDDGIGGGGGGGGTIGGGGGSRFGWYGGKIQDAVHQALNQNSETRHASIRHLRVRIWIDSTGRVTRAALAGSTGDPSVDNALKNQALVGVQLSEPPPSDMPMPVVMSIDEQRPQ